jgi:hypothetical protein
MIDPQAAPHDFWWFPYSDEEAFQLHQSARKTDG